ncbi:16S rRNA (cytosine(967)-C(5))-methyltransferase RsmB [Litorilituus lipolyticus]|uniref:16S rRNA (cytosine(967)-C(5))-methyltransferase n=1 Tax=Litorilituus lipolyticus TaxID=2491017 RepID=A0A502KSC6_9GAMM|nr:16S rRNA (cytosine(967)-C(5))-methyltransferase RsmB [Litorilituus lipolyticus]TPH13219.1 16S rRNA (cytosine(967)-C(5))-methyltransferase RsmB [Litorilituus lipolyticus]
MSKNIRALAAKCCYSVIDQGRSLSDELPKQQDKLEGKDKGLLQEICYGVLRYLPELEHDVRQLMEKPLTGKQRVFHFLLIVGVYQIKYMRIPDHAAVSETVAATSVLKNRHMKALVNGVLRNFVRQQSAEKPDNSALADAVNFNHPGWFIKKLKLGYPKQWQSILSANQVKPPMWLRVNQQVKTPENYLSLLADSDIAVKTIDPLSHAIELARPIDVLKLPGFNEGWVSVQDAAAQQAARLLDCKTDDVVLDCCAAPGGKTCHVLETTPNIASMTAIDIEEARLERVKENLTRLKLNANVITADAANPNAWWDGQLYDRILLDAPCSGTGVIRRHPDIKWLRKSSDIDALVVLQQQILKSIWSLLKPGGTLLYATCSILPEENSQQIAKFIQDNTDAQLIAITDEEDDIGWQLLPDDKNMDGFYYAKLIKKQ